MPQAEIERAQKLMGVENWSEAALVLSRFLNQSNSNAHAWYLLGQCQRFLGEISSAIRSLDTATRLDRNQGSYFLALGIANQLAGHFEASLAALRKANDVELNYVEAYMSAAMTLKRMGKLAKSAEIYDAAGKALACRCISGSTNALEGRIFGYREVRGRLWMNYALEAALFEGARSGVDNLLFPTGQSADEEYRTRRNGGRLWLDTAKAGAPASRNYLPNFFDCVREYFISGKIYFHIVGNKSLILRELNEVEAAAECAAEAEAFRSLAQ